MPANAPAADKAKRKGKPFYRRFLDWWKGGRFIALVVLLVLAVVRLYEPGPVQALRLRAFDVYQNIKPRVPPNPRPVVIVDIDEASLKEIGQWPWPRDTLAQMLDNLTKLGVLSVGFDIVFAEPDRLSVSLVADRAAQRGLSDAVLAELRALPSNDLVFANSLKQSKAVLGQSAYGEVLEGGERLPPGGPWGTRADPGLKATDYIKKHLSVVRNLQDFERAAPGLGMITVEPDPDGIVRRAPAILRVQERIFPSLIVEMFRVSTGPRTPAFTRVTTAGIQFVAIQSRPQSFEIPTTPQGDIWVYYALPGESTKDLYVSAKDVINGTIAPEKVAGKFALVGTSAVGLRDIRATPISANLPGVEVHANMIETVLQKSPLIREAGSIAAELIFAFVAGVLLIVFLPMIGAAWALGITVVLVGALFGTSWYFFSERLELIDVTYPGLSTIFLYSLLTFTTFSKTAAERRQVRGAFAQYLSPALVEQLAAEPDRLQLGGEMKEMTLLFCDLRGFTTISESFKTNPQGLTKLINKFLTPMTDIIMARQGTIDKYMGDCIMAFWNAPLDDPLHVQHAADSSLAMFDEMPKLNERLKAEAEAEGRPFHPLKVGIGLNTGEVVVGNMGSERRFDYSVLGDAVNLASRLEGQSKAYGVDVVIGELTQLQIPTYATMELDQIAVKGKKEAVRIFALLGLPAMRQDPGFAPWMEKHNAMIAAYRAQKWDEVLALISVCREMSHAVKPGGVDGFYDLYEERIAEFRENPPPPDWDGVYVATSK